MVPRTLILACLLALTAPRSAAAVGPLTRAEAIDVALARAPTQRAAQARVEQAEALQRRAWALLYPTASLNGTYTHWDSEVSLTAPGPSGGLEELVIQRQDQLDVAAKVDLTLFNYAVIPGIKNAADGVRLAELDTRAARRAVWQQTAAAFSRALAADRLAALAAAEIDRLAESLAAAEKLEALGRGDRLSTLRAGQDLLAARHEAANTARGAGFAREAVGLLMGADIADRALAPHAMQAAGPDPGAALDALLAAARANREEGPAATLRATITEREVDMVWARFLPVLGVAGNWSWTNASGFAGDATRWSLVATARWSIFDADRYGERDQREAAAAEARAQVDAVDDQLRAQVVDARQRLLDARARVVQAEALAAAADESRDAADKLFAGGRVPYLPAADARRAARLADIQVVAAALDRDLATLAWADALGAPLP